MPDVRVSPVCVTTASWTNNGVVTDKLAKAKATARSRCSVRLDGQGLGVGKTVVKARKQAGTKLELRKASRDQSPGARPECRLPIENAHAAIPSVYAANQRLMGLRGWASNTNKARTSRSSATTASEAGTIRTSRGGSEHQGDVSATDAVTVDEDGTHSGSAAHIRNVVEIALGVTCVKIDSWWNQPVAKN